MTFFKFQFIVITFFCFSCGERQTIDFTKQNKFNNIIKTEIFGDSLKIETEKISTNNYIEHYIDLKGTSDNNFDDSYNANISYYTLQIDTNLKNGFIIPIDKFQFIFNQSELIKLCELNGKLSDTLSSITSNEYWNDLKKRISNSNTINISDLRDLKMILPELKFGCRYNKSIMLDKVIMYSYQTEFSGGYNINAAYKGDTIGVLHQNEFIN
jgi:hypothetical protein